MVVLDSYFCVHCLLFGYVIRDRKKVMKTSDNKVVIIKDSHVHMNV